MTSEGKAMNRRVRIALVGLMVAGFVGAVAPGASAAAGDGLCDSGYNCIYKDLSYQGGVLGSKKISKSLWGNFAWNDKATSVSANGASCRLSNFYENARASDGAPSGDSFQIYSRSLMGSNFRDPDLRNGAGNRTDNWNDRISGFTFSGC